MKALTAKKVKLFFAASLKLILKHDDIIIMCDFTRLGIVLNIFLYIILINPLPLLASKAQSRKERERLKQQQNRNTEEERNTDFVKGKSESQALLLKMQSLKTKMFVTKIDQVDNLI